MTINELSKCEAGQSSGSTGKDRVELGQTASNNTRTRMKERLLRH